MMGALALAPSATAAIPSLSDRADWRDLLRWPNSCERDFIRGIGAGIDTDPLVGGRRLVTVTCSMGAYQGVIRLYVLSAAGRPTALRLRDVEESANGGLRSQVRSEVVGSLTSTPAGKIQILAKGRGIGDCGILRTYRLTGVNTRLTSVRAKLECGGVPPVPPSRWPSVNLAGIARV